MSEDQHPDPSQEIDIEDLYSKVQPAAEDAPSIAAWLVPVLEKHKTRIINLTRNSELGRLSAERLEKDLEQAKFPSSIFHLKIPPALPEFPGLQEAWAKIHQNYQVELTQYVLSPSSLLYIPSTLISSQSSDPTQNHQGCHLHEPHLSHWSSSL